MLKSTFFFLLVVFSTKLFAQNENAVDACKFYSMYYAENYNYFFNLYDDVYVTTKPNTKVRDSKLSNIRKEHERMTDVGGDAVESKFKLSKSAQTVYQLVNQHVSVNFLLIVGDDSVKNYRRSRSAAERELFSSCLASSKS
jgi:hypothetical protein